MQCSNVRRRLGCFHASVRFSALATAEQHYRLSTTDVPGMNAVKTHDECVVERGEDVRDAEHILPLRHLGAESDPLLDLLLLSLLVRLHIVMPSKVRLSARHARHQSGNTRIGGRLERGW